jgi:hypothetical protein
MARSGYVYLVLEDILSDGDWHTHPAAPFTVKHELVTWLSRQPVERLDNLSVRRCRDNPGPGESFTDMPIDDLLDQARAERSAS